jgi:GPI inositol-deacylase
MGDDPVILCKSKQEGPQQLLPMDDSPKAAKSFTDSQLELFDCRHGIMILHLLSTLMFVPSLVAWVQVCRSLVNYMIIIEIRRGLCIGQVFVSIMRPYVFICSNM